MAHILVVEDDEQIRVLAESILNEAGHTTASAGGLESAKALIDTEKTYDILFTNIQLGGDFEGGLAVAQYARDNRPDIKVIYTTGNGINEGLRAAFVSDFQFLAKPYTPDQLTAMLERV